jgi:ParB-like chromosome segregation protein Spo0J
MIKFPVLNVKLVNIDKIQANNYNPNKVATPEMKLLELSIVEDGYTQPIVCYHDDSIDKYIIVDGFHRYSVGKKLQLDSLPVVVIDKPIDDRIASTIRHNRARGTHQIDAMQEIMKILIDSGKSDSWISKHLGMDKDEVLRLKQLTGLAELFKNHEFSRAWEVNEK